MHRTTTYHFRFSSLIFLIACLCVFSSASQAQNSVPTSNPSGKPKVTLPVTSFDFGTVADGSNVEHEFDIKNEGTANLTIQRVVAGCGCTVTAVANNILAPGQATKIKVTVDTRGLAGNQNKAVRVYTDDPETAMSTLSIRGNVEAQVKIEPENLFFEEVTRGQVTAALTKQVKIKVGSHSDIKIGAAESFSKYVKVEEVSSNQQEKTLKVTLDPELPVGDFRERVVLNVTGAHRANVNIPIFATVRGTLRLTPPSVSFGVIAGKEIMVRRVQFENTGSAPFKIRTIESDNALVVGQVVPRKEGKSYWIDVKIDPSKVTSDVRAELKIIGENGSDEKISLNVFGVMPPKI